MKVSSSKKMAERTPLDVPTDDNTVPTRTVPPITVNDQGMFTIDMSHIEMTHTTTPSNPVGVDTTTAESEDLPRPVKSDKKLIGKNIKYTEEKPKRGRPKAIK